MSKITQSKDLQVGQWYSLCCHLDLYQVDPSDMDVLRAEFKEDEPGFCSDVWETRKEALLEIRERFVPDILWNNQARAEVDAMLAEIE